MLMPPSTHVETILNRWVNVCPCKYQVKAKTVFQSSVRPESYPIFLFIKIGSNPQYQRAFYYWTASEEYKFEVLAVYSYSGEGDQVFVSTKHDSRQGFVQYLETSTLNDTTPECRAR